MAEAEAELSCPPARLAARPASPPSPPSLAGGRDSRAHGPPLTCGQPTLHNRHSLTVWGRGGGVWAPLPMLHGSSLGRGNLDSDAYAPSQQSFFPGSQGSRPMLHSQQSPQ